MRFKENELLLLKFNYKNLHESVWEAHKVAWKVLSIFLPVLSGIQGYLIKEFLYLNLFQIFTGVFIIEFFVVTWWLTMEMLHNFNKVRRNRLKEIEGKIGGGNKNLALLKQYSLDHKYKYKISFKILYRIIFAVTTILNVLILLFYYIYREAEWDYLKF